MKITAIKAQVKRPDRVSVYVDEVYAFSLSRSQLLEQRIYANLELTSERLTALKQISDFGKGYERALMYAMLRPRSHYEMEQYCRRKKWPAPDSAAIIQKLVAQGYVDDRAFARSWVENRVLHGRASRRKLQLELKQKGVADDIIASVVETSVYNEGNTLRDLIAKKRRLTRFRVDDQKLIHYLMRQGFRFADIRQALSDDSYVSP